MTDSERHCKDVLGVLSAYIDGELSKKERDRLAAHVKACDYCAELFLSMKATRDGVVRLGKNLALDDEDAAECMEKCLEVIREKLAGREPRPTAASGRNK